MYKNVLILFSVLMCLCFCVNAQTNEAVKLPENMLGKRVNTWLKVMNSKGDEALSEFIKNEMVPNNEITFEKRMERFRGMREQLSGIALKKILHNTNDEITFLVQKGSGEWMEVQMGIETQSPNRIAGFRIEDAEPPSGTETKPVKLTDAELTPTLEKYLSELTAKDQFSGAVLIAKKGQVVFGKAFGLASREFNVPNRLDTKFNIGSINKIFTALAIGQLADAGKLSLDDKLGKHLPDYPNHQAAEKVTIRQLLNMSSGIGDFFGDDFESSPKYNFRKLQDFFPLFASKSLLFEPGTSNRYSNGGYIVLGVIIEKASGQNYYDYVRENIFKPAGMINTDSYQSDVLVPNIASGYTRETSDDGKLRNNFYTRPARGSSAGGGYSTVEDMLKFTLAFETGKLVAPKSFRSREDGPGVMLTSGLGIAGGAPGLNAAIESKVAGEYTIVVTSNLDPPTAEKVARQIRTWIKGN